MCNPAPCIYTHINAILICTDCAIMCIFVFVYVCMVLSISPNEVFGDIMVLASPPPCPPRRREHSNSEDYNNCVCSQTTLVSPKSSKCNNISISNGPIAFKFYTEVKNLKLHKKMSMTRLTPKLHSLTTLVSPKSSKCNISMNNGPIALKCCTGVQSQ